MSGIVGLLRQDNQPVDRNVFEAMVDLLKHRGPDGRGVWHGPHVSLGHQKLITTPESKKEVFPLEDCRRSVVLTADARIDNRAELIQLLGLYPSSGKEMTDADLILAAYERWGTACPEKLIGAYAFAIWDESHSQVFCARDHYGLKPFYYCHLAGRLFAFASEIKSILHHPEIPQALNETAVADHLLMPVQADATITFYKKICRLAPAHCLLITADKCEISRYWALDPHQAIDGRTDEEYAAELLALFKEAVSCRMRSAFPIGSMLSGGLDSSAIVSMAAQLKTEGDAPLYTYSAVFNKMQQSDERPYINMVLEKYGDRLRPNAMPADALSPLVDYDQMLWHQDSAIQAGNLYFFWNLFAQARDQGMRVVMDGFDGDTTLSHGVGYLHELAGARQWSALFREVRSHSLHWGKPWGNLAWEWFHAYEVAPVLKRWPMARHLRRAVRTVRGALPRANAPASKALTWEQVVNRNFGAQMQDTLQPGRKMSATEREEHHYLLNRPVMHRIIEVWEAAAAAAGLELRLPFCDRRLMEFCLALPPDQKRRNGWSRVAMRHAMEGILPPGIQWRADKGNLGPSFDHGLLVKAADDLNRMIEEDTGGVGRFVDLNTLQKTRPAFKQESMDHFTIHHWRALSLALWLQYTGL